MAEESKIGLEGGGGKSPKREAKKMYYPFGSSVNVSYNQYAHLGGDTKTFAESLCVSTNIVAEVRGDESDLERKSKKEGAGKSSKTSDKSKSKVQMNPELLNELNLDNQGDQCTKKACQDVIRKILESQSMNKLERDEIAEDFERLTAELVEQEAINATLETKLEMITRDGDQLERTLSHLNTNLKDLEKTRHDLQVEKDSFNGKKMSLDIERQTWVRQKQEAETALNAALWKTNNNSDDNSSHPSLSDSMRSSMTIKKSTKKSLRMATDVSLLSYNSLATDYVMDYLERPRNIPTLPRYLNDQILLPALNKGHKNSFFKTSITTSDTYIDDAHSVNTPLSHGSTRQSSRSIGGARSPKQSLKKIRAASPFLHMEGDAYKGYTPTGSPAYRYRSDSLDYSSSSNNFADSTGGLDDLDQRSIGSRSFKSMSSMGMLSAMFNPQESLDPVFYSNKARMDFNRKQPLGKLRIREHSKDESLSVANSAFNDDSTISSQLTIISKASNKQLVEHLKVGFTGKQGNGLGVNLTSKHPGLSFN